MNTYNVGEILCELVGADSSDNTITLQLPSGLRPCGMVIGETLTIIGGRKQFSGDAQQKLVESKLYTHQPESERPVRDIRYEQNI